jgi:hypothetical protein
VAALEAAKVATEAKAGAKSPAVGATGARPAMATVSVSASRLVMGWQG